MCVLVSLMWKLWIVLSVVGGLDRCLCLIVFSICLCYLCFSGLMMVVLMRCFI